MSQNKARIDGSANDVRMQQPNEIVCSMLKYVGLATIGDGAVSAVALLSGILNRTGPTAAYADTLPTADAVLAAAPTLGVGDSFSLIVRNTVAFANTITTNTGMILGTNTAIAASLVREFLFTLLSKGTAGIYSGVTTNTDATITGLTSSQVATLSPGMGVTGTGIPALTTIIGVNSTLGTLELSANATASGTVGLTFFNRISVEGVRSSTL